MRLALARNARGQIIPATEEDRLKLRAWKAGEVVIVKATRPRNVDHWRKFMALVSFVREHHPDYRGFASNEPLLETLKRVTGHVNRWVIPSTGEVGESTRSVSFEVMDEAEFVQWSAKAKPYLVELMDQFTERTKRRHEQEIDGWTHWCLH